MKEKYIVRQVSETVGERIREGYELHYYKNDKFERSVRYYNVEFVEMLLCRFKKECPSGQIIFPSAKEFTILRPEELIKLERKVREYEL